MCLNFINFIVLSTDLKNSIQELLIESRSFNKNDVLVHADSESKQLFFSDSFDTIPKNDFPAKIHKETRKNLRESGVNTLCHAKGFLISRENSIEYKSPILLAPVVLIEDKIRNTISLKIEEELSFINPYIEHLLFKKETELNIDSTDQVFDFLQNVGFEIDLEGHTCVGNFHHHRYSVLKELESLLEIDDYSSTLKSLFGIEKARETFPKLPADILFAADLDHERVFDRFSHNNLVVQGPPGTGKSQVLTNLVGKLLASGQSTIVLSEKYAAMDVIRQKLQEFDLDRLAYIATSDTDVHRLLQEIKESWKFFEETPLDRIPNIRLSEQNEDQLQFSLDVLNQTDAIGGISLYAFKQELEQIDLSAALFVSNPTEIESYRKSEATIESVYLSSLNDVVGLFRADAFRREDFSALEKVITENQDQARILSKNVPLENWSDLLQLMKLAALCQVLENDLYKKLTPLYKPNSRAQNKFIKLRNRYNVLKHELNEINEQPSHWNILPSKEEIEFLQKLRAKSSLTSRLKFKKHWKKFSRIPSGEAQYALDTYHQILEKKDSFSQIIADFIKLGIEKPEIELEIVHASIHQLGEEQWSILSEIPLSKRAFITHNHELISKLYHGLKSYLNLDSETPILESLIKLQASFGEIVSIQNSLMNLDDVSLQLFSQAKSKAHHKASVYYSHWKLFQQRFPSFAKFEISTLQSKAQEIISDQKTEAKLFANNILKSVQEAFESYHALLNTPARKLTEEQKELKQRLKKGKSILVKEFSKTRSHPSLRELFSSEARLWIQLLKPIWLSNPTQVAKSFKLEKDLFDVAIFDEASQIPVQNALGALQRVKHGIIAGDGQQMGPSLFFKSGNSEVMDLLHQASFYWETCSLKHHYRSLHPELISFSNQHFYGNELKAFPAYNVSFPIHFHRIESGIFEERKNIEEAKSVAQFISETLKTEKSIGVVAFSEEQLNCIWNELDSSSQNTISELVESGNSFFKAVENVQGDECDQLIISFGYAKDSEGEFSMRFGPMNTTNGRRRLNVLLTRARKRLDFFASVQSKDFKLSDNESVDLLRLWFTKLDQLSSETNLPKLPFNGTHNISGDKLTLSEPHKYLRDARELVTFQSVMESRGWKIKYQ